MGQLISRSETIQGLLSPSPTASPFSSPSFVYFASLVILSLILLPLVIPFLSSLFPLVFLLLWTSFHLSYVSETPFSLVILILFYICPSLSLFYFVFQVLYPFVTIFGCDFPCILYIQLFMPFASPSICLSTYYSF